MEKRIRKKAVCVKCGEEAEIKAFGECIKCYNSRRRNKKKFDWSYEHPFCIICKTTKYKHHGKGICIKCRYKHDAIYIKLQTKRNLTRGEYKRKGIYRTEEKKKLYQATERGLKSPFNNKEKIKDDIKIIKKEIKRIKQNGIR